MTAVEPRLMCEQRMRMNAALTHEEGNLRGLARRAARNATERLLSLIEAQRLKVTSHRATIHEHVRCCEICRLRDGAES